MSVDVGYRVEPVSSGVTRITMVYSVYPSGHMSRYQYYIDLFQRYFMMSLPGLRDMLSQIPEYHIFNLIERIVKGIQPTLPPTVLSRASSRSAQKDTESGELISDVENKDSIPDEESEETIPDAALLPPYITNTIPHASECDVMVSTLAESEG